MNRQTVSSGPLAGSGSFVIDEWKTSIASLVSDVAEARDIPQSPEWVVVFYGVRAKSSRAEWPNVIVWFCPIEKRK
jgi:hypothetical protein